MSRSAVELFDLHADGEPPADPFALARQWLPADDEPDRPRVTLSTIGEDGYPDARTVLLSAFDATGFAFHTAATSRKVAELAAAPPGCADRPVAGPPAAAPRARRRRAPTPPRRRWRPGRPGRRTCGSSPG
ncbi:hypothetical protein A7K94_0220370 [Modestobacter sp. VKM Ac-2676]|nr:hypothetical protein A7K94_0220370 [Modestobacter sp. VKM Ac-2676]